MATTFTMRRPAVAVTVAEPTAAGAVKVTEARPAASVTAVAADNVPVPVMVKLTVTPGVAVGNCAEITDVVLMATVLGVAVTTNAPAGNVIGGTLLAKLPEDTLTTTSPGAVPFRITDADETPLTSVVVVAVIVVTPPAKVPLPEMMVKVTTVPSTVPAGRVAVMVDVDVPSLAIAEAAEAAGAVTNGVVFGPSSPHPAITNVSRVNSSAIKLFTFMILLLFVMG
jgi:hypothetical protein